MLSRTLTRRTATRLVLALGLAVSSGAAFTQTPAPEATVIDMGGTVLSFVSQAQTKQLIQDDDAWLQSTSAFQRAITMGEASPSAPSVARFQSFLATTARPWTSDEVARWQAAAQKLAKRLTQLQLAHRPPRIQLALTDGRDAARTPYTRGDVIYLPQRYPSQDTSDLELLAHEYFHILTRENPALAERIYALLGFSSAGELEWPKEWLPARIANPDAPFSKNVMRLERSGKTIYVMPVLVAQRTVLRPGETLFHVLDVRLLSVTPGTGNQPSRALRDPHGQLQWTDAYKSRDYLKRLGGNTQYVIHPEETAADNFSYLVSDRKVRNPQLLTQLAQLLREHR